MSDGTGLAEALLGLDGFRVLEVIEGVDELVIGVETDAVLVGCNRCGVRAVSHGRMTVEVRDLPASAARAAGVEQAAVALRRR